MCQSQEYISQNVWSSPVGNDCDRKEMEIHLPGSLHFLDF